MPKTAKKTSPATSVRPGNPLRSTTPRLNPRQKPDLRWQRAKRYNWDGR